MQGSSSEGLSNEDGDEKVAVWVPPEPQGSLPSVVKTDVLRSTVQKKFEGKLGVDQFRGSRFHDPVTENARHS